MIKKLTLTGLIVLLICAAFPFSSVFAAPLPDDPNPETGKDSYPRLEKAFQRIKAWYEKQDKYLEKSDDFIARAETFIAKAEARGLDVSSLRSLLDNFTKSLPVVRSAHERAGEIIASHNGFEENGKVVDAIAAAQTVKDAASALQEARQAHLGKAKVLAEAINAFWRANKPPRSNSDTAFPLPASGE